MPFAWLGPTRATLLWLALRRRHSARPSRGMQADKGVVLRHASVCLMTHLASTQPSGLAVDRGSRAPGARASEQSKHEAAVSQHTALAIMVRSPSRQASGLRCMLVRTRGLPGCPPDTPLRESRSAGLQEGQQGLHLARAVRGVLDGAVDEATANDAPVGREQALQHTLALHTLAAMLAADTSGAFAAQLAAARVVHTVLASLGEGTHARLNVPAQAQAQALRLTHAHLVFLQVRARFCAVDLST